MPLSLERMGRQSELVRMDATRTANSGDQCLSRWCGKREEVGGKIKVPASHTLPASSMVEVIWHRQHAHNLPAPNSLRLHGIASTCDSISCHCATYKITISWVGIRTRPDRVAS